jgi:type IV pilus assembly protein PilM
VFSRKTVILDLGASRTALGRFSLNQGRLRLDELLAEIIPGPADWLAQTQTALAALRTRTSTRDPVVLVLPPHLTLTKLIKIPRIDPAKRGKVLRFEAEQNMPFAPADMVWDTVAAAEHEAEIESLLVAARREAIEELCGGVRASGFEPQAVLPSALATLAAFRLVQGESTEPTLVLNFGARSTTLSQVAVQRFSVRSLALGTRNMMWKTAEQQDPVALEIIVTRLAQEITRSVLHFRRQGTGGSPARICLTGGGARLSGLGEALAEKLKLPVHHLDLSASIEIPGSVVPAGAVGHDLMLCDLAGAAATQLRPGQAVLNLLPPLLRQQSSRRHQLWLAASALVTTVAVWTLLNFLHPAAEPVPAAALTGTKAVPHKTEAPAPPSAAILAAPEVPFDFELLEVKTAPFPLELAGYFGEPGDYLVAFIRAGQPETLLARRGHRFEQLGLTLRSFEVRNIAVDHADAWPVYEAAGCAVLHYEKTDGEVVLDSRRKHAVLLQAELRAAGEQQSILRQEGELIVQRGAAYRIQRIRNDPPEVVMVRQAVGPGMPEMRVLHQVRQASGPGEESANPETGLVPNGL